MSKGFYTVKEVAKLTGQHPNTVRSKIKRGLYSILIREEGSREPFLIAKESLEVIRHI